MTKENLELIIKAKFWVERNLKNKQRDTLI